MLVFPQPMEITRATAISYHVVIAFLGFSRISSDWSFCWHFLLSIRSLRYWDSPASWQNSRQSFRSCSARPDALLESHQALPWHPLRQWAISAS